MEQVTLPPPPPRIQALPQEVVDRIAAGEVVQRPASLVKELIENSLDADSHTIDIQCTSGGLSHLSVTDDGTGIYPHDLKLAATRFATSKLVTFDDLKSIQTLGFRGEALASASMVSRLTIVSRRRQKCLETQTGVQEETDFGPGYSTNCAYRQQYHDGKPMNPKPIPSSGTEGTTVKVQDLFYNIPARRRAFDGTRKEREEYQRILNVVQRYAVYKAGVGVGFVCRKKGKNADLNTSSSPYVKQIYTVRPKQNVLRNVTETEGQRQSQSHLTSWDTLRQNATKDAIGHIFGTRVAQQLLVLSCGVGNVEEVSLAALKGMPPLNDVHDSGQENKCDFENIVAMKVDGELGANNTDFEVREKKKMVPTHSQFAYRASGFLSNGSYCVPKSSSAFILFINGRLVESKSLRHAVESEFLDILLKGSKPFVFLDVEIPGPHVDVNVHPTKREVIFLHEDRLCDALAKATSEILGTGNASRTFYTQSLLPAGMTDVNYKRSLNKYNNIIGEHDTTFKTIHSENKTRHSLPEDNDEDHLELFKQNGNLKTDEAHKKKRSLQKLPLSSQKKKHYDPKTMVRVSPASQQGLLEPFIIHVQQQAQHPKTQNNDIDSAQEGGKGWNVKNEKFLEPDHKCKEVDMSIPGAFASICKCQIKRGSSFKPISRNSSGDPAPPIVKIKKVLPTECMYKSIQLLRSDITTRSHGELTTKIRESVFVGCISRYRSLFQWGEELLMMSHYNLARELFYQLALSRFGGASVAKLGREGVNVKFLIEQSLQFEETHKEQSLGYGDIRELQVSKINSDLGRQATKCLFEHANMLREYFSINFVKKENQVFLIGLPILLDGHTPCLHSLPIFLLRLATEVDWEEEQDCFEGICTELGSYYAEIPYDAEMKKQGKMTDDKKEMIDDSKELFGESEKKFIQHTIFPALHFLLVPTKELASNGSVVKLAVLSKLYKVFERC